MNDKFYGMKREICLNLSFIHFFPIILYNILQTFVSEPNQVSEISLGERKVTLITTQDEKRTEKIERVQ